MFHVSGTLRIFFWERAPNFVTFFKLVFFSAQLIISNLSDKRTLRGSGSILLRKIFENLHTVMAILMLCEDFSGKVCLYFWPLSFSVSPNMMYFVRTLSIMRA